MHDFVCVENQQKLAVQLEGSADERSVFALKRFRWYFEVISIDLHDITDLVDKQTDWPIRCSNHNIHRPTVCVSSRQAQAMPQRKSSHNLTAQIHQPLHDNRGQWNACCVLVPNDFLYLANFNTEVQIIDSECAVRFFDSHERVLAFVTLVRRWVWQRLLNDGSVLKSVVEEFRTRSGDQIVKVDDFCHAILNHTSTGKSAISSSRIIVNDVDDLPDNDSDASLIV